MDYSIRHRTLHRYAQETTYSHHLVHLSPHETPTQHVKPFNLLVSPTSAHRTRKTDFFDNPTEWLALNEAHSAMERIAQSRVAAFCRRAAWARR
jgi:transglutaminase-like putative cysteine protease